MVSVVGTRSIAKANIPINIGVTNGQNNRVVEMSGFGIKCYQVKKAKSICL